MTVTLNPSVVEIEGEKFFAHPATIEGFRIFREDHGILTCFLDLSLATGGSQGFGGYGLDEYVPKDQPRPTGYVCDRIPGKHLGGWILGLTTVLGELPPKVGSRLYALKENEGWNEYVRGILSFGGERYFVPKWL